MQNKPFRDFIKYAYLVVHPTGERVIVGMPSSWDRRFCDWIRTSPVVEITHQDGKIMCETLNSIYQLDKEPSEIQLKEFEEMLREHGLSYAFERLEKTDE